MDCDRCCQPVVEISFTWCWSRASLPSSLYWFQFFVPFLQSMPCCVLTKKEELRGQFDFQLPNFVDHDRYEMRYLNDDLGMDVSNYVCDAICLPYYFIVLPLNEHIPNTVKILPFFFIVKFYRVGELWPKLLWYLVCMLWLQITIWKWTSKLLCNEVLDFMERRKMKVGAKSPSDSWTQHRIPQRLLCLDNICDQIADI